MSRQSKHIQIALVLQLLLLAAIALLLAPVQQAAPPAPPQSYDVLQLSAADVAAVAIMNQDAAYGLIVQGDRVLLEPNSGLPTSQTELRATFYALAHLTAHKSLGEVRDILPYGFDTPTATISYILADQTTRLLLLGAQNPLDGSYYLFNQATGQVYLIDSATASVLLRTPRDFAPRNLFPSIPLEELDRVQQVSVAFAEGKGQSYTLVNQGELHFTLTHPVQGIISAVPVLVRLLAPLTSLYPQEVLSADGLQTFGDAPPDCTITLVADGQSYTCLFRKEATGWLVMAQGSELVYRVPVNEAEFLRMEYLSLFEGKIYTFNPNDIATLAIRWQDRSLRLDFTGEQTALQATDGIKTYHYEQLTPLLEGLCSLPMAGELSQPPTADTPTVTLTVTAKNGRVDVVELYPPQNSLCPVGVNGSICFTATASSVQAALNILNTF